MGQGDLPITRLEDLELFRIAPAVASYPVAIDEFGMFSTVFGSTSALGSDTVRVASGPVVAATSFWSGGATHDPNAHVRPWGTIAR